ncbi:MAG: hypothetical protein EOP83_19740 [Verrucomicrobiaceae bacterium]|nr:MAG: hypothetical protein EOP83_19740 [Verrucomicrobiaceae bacterium]
MKDDPPLRPIPGQLHDQKEVGAILEGHFSLLGFSAQFYLNTDLPLADLREEVMDVAFGLSIPNDIEEGGNDQLAHITYKPTIERKLAVEAYLFPDHSERFNGNFRML